MNNKKTLKSFAIQNTIIALTAIVLTCGILGIITFTDIIGYYTEMAESKLTSAAVSVSEMVSGEIIENLPLTDNKSPEYLEIYNICKKITDRLELEYIFIVQKTSSGNEFAFLLDTDPETYIGEIYEVDDATAGFMNTAFSGKNCVSDIYEDEWGSFISGYAPIYDRSGKVTAIVGADLNALAFQQSVSNELASYILRCAVITIVILAVFTAITFVGYLQIKSKLVFVITKMRNFSNSVFKSVNLFDDGSKLLASKSLDAADAISGMSAVLDKISSEIKTTDDNTQKAADYFTTVSAELNQGAVSIENLSGSIKDIENSGNEITSVIDIINSIAKKTKILAINAEVEAARVGEAGKSFAVVAQEVGNLAQSVENAAKNTGNIIEKNKNYIKKAVENAEGVENTIFSIEKEVNILKGIISEVSGASAEQTKSIGELRGDMNSIKGAASENAISAGEITSSTKELSSMTDDLNDHVESLKKTIANNAAI